MRITNNMMVNRMMGNLNRNIIKLDKRQLQVATGKKFHSPADDPIGLSKSLKLRSDLSELDQFKRNVDDALSFLETTELAAKSLGNALARLRELTVQASNGVLTPEDTKKIESEVAELRSQIIGIGNNTYAGKYVFSGKKTDQPLFDAQGNYNVNLTDIIDPSGIDDRKRFSVGVYESVEINTLGFELFDLPTPDGKIDVNATQKSIAAIDAGGNSLDLTPGLIQLFKDIESYLNAGDFSELTASLADIDKYINANLTVRSEIGGKVNRLELVIDRIGDETLNFTNLLSKIEDADMAEVIMQLTNEENVYRASLNVGARIIQPSLLDFLR